MPVWILPALLQALSPDDQLASIVAGLSGDDTDNDESFSYEIGPIRVIEFTTHGDIDYVDNHEVGIGEIGA